MPDGNPFETFPGGLARQILALAQRNKQRAAELGEMRRVRAARNFLEKERQALLEGRQGLERARLQLQANRIAGEQAIDVARLQQADVANQISLLRAQLEVERLRRSDADKLQKALFDFRSEGMAVLPWHATGFVQKLAAKDGSYEIDSTPIPGLGIVVRRIGGPEAESLRLARAKREQIEATTARLEAEREAAAALAAQRRARAQQIAKQMADGQFDRLATLLQARRTILSTAANEARDLERRAELMMFDNEEAANELLQRATKLRRNPESIFPPGSRWAQILENLDVTVAGAMEAASRPFRNRIENRTDQEDLDAATGGLFSSGLDNPLGLMNAMVDDPDLPTTSENAWRSLPVTLDYRGPDKRIRQFYADPLTSRLVPLNEDAYRDALRDPNIRKQLHPLWRKVGWGPRKAAGTDRAPERPLPAEPAPSPLPSDDIEAQAARLLDEFETARAAGDTNRMDAIRGQLSALRTQLVGGG